MARIINNLYRSATGQAVLLFAYLFLVVTSYVVGKVARDALFLDQFKAVQLPYADIAIAALVGFVVAAYVRIGRLVRLDRLLMLSLAAYSVTSVAFWYAATHYRFAWLYPLVYVWIGIFGVLATAQVWTLANYVFTTREAKSSFSVIGSGAISGWIAGGYISKALAAGFGAESLLLVMAVATAISIVIVSAIWSARTEHASTGTQSESRGGVGARFREVWSMPHLRAIAALICLSSFATTIAGWQFKAIAKQSIGATDSLAAFFGEFNFYAGILSLLVQLLLTSRLLKRFGIGPALLVVPVALLIGSAGVIVLGTLTAAAALKGFDQVFRYSVDKSSVELLYLPVPAELKIEAKSFIDTVIWRMGDGLAGIAVLLSANYLGLSARSISWVTLAVVATWVTVALLARRTYVASLRNIVQVCREPEPQSATASEAAFAVPAEPSAYYSERQLAEMLETGSVNVQREAIQHIGSGQRRQFALALIERLPNPELGEAAAAALVAIGDDITGILCVHAADRNEAMPLRLHVIDVLARIGTLSAERVLEVALVDPDAQVRDRATLALGRLLRETPEVTPDRTNVESALAIEVAQHYRSYQVLLRLSEAGTRTGERTAPLRTSMDAEARRIFRLLGVLYPDRDLDSAYAAIRSRVPALRDSAIELLDNTLDQHLRKLLLPLFDEALSIRERARIARRLLGDGDSSRQPMLALTGSRESWFRRAATLSLGELKLCSCVASIPASTTVSLTRRRSLLPAGVLRFLGDE